MATMSKHMVFVEKDSIYNCQKNPPHQSYDFRPFL